MTDDKRPTTSQGWHELASQVIPGGVSSPVRSFKHVGGSPVFFERAKGAMLYDVEGREYVDFCMGFGPHVLGHSPAPVVEAIREQAQRATTFGACSPNEVELARHILRGYPFLGRVRLVNSGTEAVMTAIRIARGFTGRDKILMFEGCYHGHSDGLLAKAGSGVAALAESSSKGVPQSVVSDTLIARYDSLDDIRRVFAEHGPSIAAVVMEPVPANHGLWVPTKEHIAGICRIARDAGSLVLFDEVISGFRMGLSGASGYFDQQPDLVTLGKIVGGGMPLAAVAGRREVMEVLAPMGPVYQAGTLSGNPLAAAAGCAVMTELFRNPPYAAFEFAGTAFVEGLRRALEPWGEMQIRNLGSMFWLHFGPERREFPPTITADSAKRYAAFFRAALAKGVYFPPSPYEVGFLSAAHTPEVLSGVLEKLKECRP